MKKYTGFFVFFFCWVSAASAACLHPTTTPTSWGRSTIESYQACIAAAEKKAENDPGYAGRQFERIGNKWIWNSTVKAGLKYFKLNKITMLEGYLRDLYESDYLTDATQRGINARFTSFKTRYEALQNNPQAAVADAATLATEWDELEHLLAGSLTDNSTDAEKALVSKLIRQGKLAVDQAAMTTITKHGSRDAIATRRYLETRLGNLDSSIKAIKSELMNVAEAAKKEVDFKSQQLAIAKYSALAGTFLEAGLRAGIFSGPDVARGLHVVDGVSKLATATAMFQEQAGYVTLAGPYGLAFAGMLSISSAFADSGPSDTEVILSALQAISEQIAQLQFTVEEGFTSLSAQITESEIRIMGRLVEILQSNTTISTKLTRVSDELKSLREEWLVSHRNDQHNSILSFWRAIAYRDDACLRSFNLFQRNARNDCISEYARLVRTFEVEKNSLFVGALLPSFLYATPFNDRLTHIKNSAEKYGISFGETEPVHIPTLERISNRLKLLLAYNNELARHDQFSKLLRDVDSMETDGKMLLSVLGAAEVRSQLNAAYAEKIQLIFDKMEMNEASYIRGRDVNLGDEIHNLETRNYNLSTSYHQAANQYSSSHRRGPLGVRGRAARVFANVVDAPDASVLLNDFENRLAHKLIGDKLANIAAIALTKDAPATLAYNKHKAGYHWVRPCNVESGYPSFPVRREFLSRHIPTELVSASIGSKSVLHLCYNPDVRRNLGNIGIGNTNTGMRTVKARLKSIGLPYEAYDFSDDVFCVKAGRNHFRKVYEKYAEYSRSDWEKCHRGHIHHKLYVASKQAYNFTYVVTVNLENYPGSLNRFQYQVNLKNSQLDKCFLPLDRKNQPNKNAVFMPYRQLYPLPVTKACIGVDNGFIKAITEIGPKIHNYINAESATPSDGGTVIPYIDAIKKTAIKNSFSIRAELMEGLFHDIDFAELNELSDLVAISNAVTETPDDSRAGFWPSENEFKRFVETVVFDDATVRINPVQSVRSTFETYQEPF